MKGNFTDRKDALRALRWDRAKKNKVLWGLFVLSFVLSFLCPLLINIEYCAIFYPTLNAVLNGLANISFGYFSGFLVYIFSSFFPSTKKDIEIIDSIFFNLYLISELLNTISDDFIPDNKRINSNTFECSLFNYLVEGSVLNEIKDLDNLPDTLRINNANYIAIEMRLALVNENIDKLVTSYRRELKSNEIEVLTSLSNVKNELIDSVDSSKTVANKDRLSIFIMNYYGYFLQFHISVCSEYSRYKYCKYNISRFSE